MKHTKTPIAPQIIAIIFLTVALIPSNPYGYYILLRWICFAVFAYLTYIAVNNNKINWGWTLGLIAFLYNPFIRFHLSREIWTIINLATLLTTVISIRMLGPKKGETENENN